MDALKTEVLISLISGAVHGCEPVLPDGCELSEDLLLELYNVSRNHDAAHLVGAALGYVDCVTVPSIYGDSTFFAIYRYENMSFTLKNVSAALESAGIPFIPLKGAVIAELYPEPWMRTSCDIDILVHEQDTERAVNELTEKLGFSSGEKGRHDVVLTSAEGISLELHFTLLEDDDFRDASEVLSKVWSCASPVKEGGFEYRLSSEMLCFYHIVHMARHFICGGCGIRPFLDLYLITDKKNERLPYGLLKRAGLVKFGESVAKLSNVWFGNGEHDEVTLEMQEFIIDGGKFGSDESRIAAWESVAGGKKKYVASRIFLPYDKLKYQYPVLGKYRFLTPACEICRLFSLAAGKKKKVRKKQFDRMNKLSEGYAEKTAALFEKIF